MRRPTLIRRRELWMPTFSGWIAILLLIATICVLVVANLYAYLAPNEPVRAHLLVIEGWMEPQDLDQAIAVFRTQGYEHIVTTGGPTMRWPEDRQRSTYAELSADYLRQKGLSPSTVTAVPAPYRTEDHTFESAVAVREWARKQGMRIDSLDIFSSSTHARRSRLLYQWAFGPQVKIGIFAAPAADYDSRTWWATSSGLRDVLVQAGGLIWVRCCFRPPVPRGGSG